MFLILPQTELVQISKLDLKREYVLSLEKAMAPHSSTLAWKIHGQRDIICKCFLPFSRFSFHFINGFL